MFSDLPLEFTKRIQAQLGGEYAEFAACYNDKPARGVRVNTLKIEPDDFLKQAPFDMGPVWWVRNGFYVSSADDPAKHPLYRAGLYYIQEPSAMTPADRLPVEPGDMVLDLCAAPGGKATAIAGKLKQRGLLLANDVTAARCRALLHNLQLAGAENIVVTNEAPWELDKKLPGFFDKIMVDAPCSGEGMFRKDEKVIKEWSLKRVDNFAKQQRGILSSAIKMLKAGGVLMYSTCTYSPQENEGSVSFVLEEYPEMELVDMDWHSGFSKGVPSFGNGDERLQRTVRIWPHKMKGEGHYMALFKKSGTASGIGVNATFRKDKAQSRYVGGKKGRIKQNVLNGSFGAEEKHVMDEFLKHVDADIDKSRLENIRGRVYLLPEGFASLPRLRTLCTGLFMGELKKSRFEPSQAFALSEVGSKFRSSISFSSGDERLFRYFRGESIVLDGDERAIPDGFVLIEADGFAVGFGKKTGNMIKSKYVFLK